MVLFYCLPQSRPHDMGIDLGGRDVGMSQHDLQATKVRSAFEQVGGEAMAEHVGGKAAENSRFPAVSRQEFPESLTGETTAARGYKQIAAGAALQQSRPAGRQILFYGLDRCLPCRDQSLLIPLPHRP